MPDRQKILILGAGGMLGNTLFRYFFADPQIDVVGTLRSATKADFFTPAETENLVVHVDVENDSGLEALFSKVQPNVVINCVGIIKQVKASKSYLDSLSINAVLPHRLLQHCIAAQARLVHLSTDCVFAGTTGNYTETDFADADDLYGRSKFLGEVQDPNSITLRTSIIGHELTSACSLIDWFLSQNSTIKGFQKAIFSGLPTVEVARIIHQHVLPNPDLSGLYHLSADPINKFDLLSLVADIYGKDIEILPDEDLVIDRSLNSDRFRKDANFSPPAWPELIKGMHADFLSLSQRQQIRLDRS